MAAAVESPACAPGPGSTGADAPVGPGCSMRIQRAVAKGIASVISSASASTARATVCTVVPVPPSADLEIGLPSALAGHSMPTLVKGQHTY